MGKFPHPGPALRMRITGQDPHPKGRGREARERCCHFCPLPEGEGRVRAMKNKLTERPRILRQNMPDAEWAFRWQVRDRRFEGLILRRHVRIGLYIVDFLCFKKWVIVELDDEQHAENAAYDTDRTRFLNTWIHRGAVLGQLCVEEHGQCVG